MLPLSAITNIPEPSPHQSVFLSDLLCKDGDQWFPIPQWAQFFVDLGAQLTSYSGVDGMLVMAVALPTRAYAAAFAATGVILARAGIPQDHVDAAGHFEFLCRLATEQVDTPVTYREQIKGQTRSRNGRLKGVRTFDGKPVLDILVAGQRSRWLTQLVTERRSLNVQLARNAGAIGSTRKIIATPFLTESLPAMDSIDFMTRTRLECIILGTATQLIHEIINTSFACGGVQGPHDVGCLQDIVRVRRFLPASEHYRSEIVPVAHESEPAGVPGGCPATVVFDGAAGFLRWRDNWRGIPWLVLLDRTDPHFEEAMEAVKAEDMGRAGDAAGLKVPPIPNGIELTTFEVAP